ncbi:hypothetical protein DSM106972_038530 [Dulcicalothrix desertica PCC 7102]|uniref:NERD domain-containing protein n=1 Tax=Dulcicalothrix desertica PCC 7102 TaxID=232991 RepID=A0A3S1CN22_9CYAN|nr:nuclease-related domain-containing protein [Dulcicalothrix desertica]RUT05032.1 hypothetical protein DSM106972_038530 [Dulcicalothrix desertica PCC 7102]TWH62573.1 nuclease-like protein [Dulcicalothrix desertica PCC 7102]
MSKAGENIRELATQRRTDAYKKIGIAVITGLAPVILLLLRLPAGIAVLAWVGCWGVAYVYFNKGQHLLLRARQADQGAVAEENVAELLKPLELQGWKIEYNVVLEYGDADAFLQAPNGECFVIDTKSNKGSVFYDGAVLKLRYGKQVYEFGNGKNILKAVKGQARALREMKRVNFVQPILCFTQARMEEIDQNNKIDNVYVLDTANLLRVITSL